MSTLFFFSFAACVSSAQAADTTSTITGNIQRIQCELEQLKRNLAQQEDALDDYMACPLEFDDNTDYDTVVKTMCRKIEQTEKTIKQKEDTLTFLESKTTNR